MTGSFQILSITPFTIHLSGNGFFLSCYHRAIAASAPIFQFSGLTSCEAFSRIVTADYNSASTECAASIRKSWAEINNITSSGNAYEHFIFQDLCSTCLLSHETKYTSPQPFDLKHPKCVCVMLPLHRGSLYEISGFYGSEDVNAWRRYVPPKCRHLPTSHMVLEPRRITLTSSPP
jgi:hypothetical protein